MYVWGCTCHSACVMVKGQLCGLLVNQVTRLQRQTPLLAELTHWSYRSHTLFSILLKIIFENFHLFIDGVYDSG